uniref:Coenzyme Q5, methyltransferase n=2 Tax=Sinocyclocheilus grahami TaxID=75366 RepID=A0A672NUI9_SINGR
MAASIRTHVLRVLSDFTRNIPHVSRCPVKHVCCRAGLTGRRGYSDSTEDRSTHTHTQWWPKLLEHLASIVHSKESLWLELQKAWDNISVEVLRKYSDTMPERCAAVTAAKGDISFRFLEYTRSMYDRQQRMRAKSHPAPSWQDIADRYASDEAGPPQSHAVVCDGNKDMRQRMPAVGDAEELPFDDDQNVTHIEQFEMMTLLAGSKFSKVTNPLLARLYDAYSFQMIPVLGEVIAGDWKSYQYLVESIQKFPDQETFKEMIEDAGFFCVQYFNLTGGIVAVHSGFKL